jgi:hypothetical protein
MAAHLSGLSALLPGSPVWSKTHPVALIALYAAGGQSKIHPYRST